MRNQLRLYGSILLAACLLPAVSAGAQPTVAGTYQNRMQVRLLANLNANPTQMAWGPDGRLYLMTTNAGVLSFAYNRLNGAVYDQRTAVPFDGIGGIGLAFHGSDLYVTGMDGSIHKLTDTNHNGLYGETALGELNVKIVTGIPTGDHNVDQLQIQGDTLYVGVGRRTINGRKGNLTSGSLSDPPGTGGFWSGGNGYTWGDCAYGGTICWIQNLTLVPDRESAANTYASTTITQFLIQQNTNPYTTNDPAKLVVHSAGTRNPFGLCFDRDGHLWFTNNFNRTATMGNGESGFGYPEDSLGPDFSKDVQDQVFEASAGADYGYADDNWRGVNPMMTPGTAGYHRVLCTTFDNLFNKGPYVLHDPANPDGLGPSSSSDGCAFCYAPGLPAELAGNLFIAQYQSSITEAPGNAVQHTLTYSDLVAVDTSTGKVRRVAYNFSHPLAVLWDGGNRLLIADYSLDSDPHGYGALYALEIATPLLPTPARPIGTPIPHLPPHNR